MKSYRTQDSLRLVGKAWEIRLTLRRMAESRLTLHDYLNAGRRSASSTSSPASARSARRPAGR
ncbi:Z-ring formation inhibitor MciZ [Paenibacillus cymbidii]|uniref:Z-ring formation inhibitor MciZ n=1 Tax=Paenibacillus cymbidii TaxID=1639034 RepID=UPI00108133C4|nr:Z-ring formation inhibitor MciZ [Paenibacillus cymbidii]